MCTNAVVFSYAVVTREIKLFHNYFSLRRRPTYIIILFQRVETCLKLCQNYFGNLLQLVNIFQHVQYSAAEIILFQFKTWLHAK